MTWLVGIPKFSFGHLVDTKARYDIMGQEV